MYSHDQRNEIGPGTNHEKVATENCLFHSFASFLINGHFSPLSSFSTAYHHHLFLFLVTMSTSPTYIEAAQAGIADALKTAAVYGVTPPSYTLGLQAVRNCGYETQANSKKDHSDAILSACYILGSVHDQGMQDLMKDVSPINPREQRIASVLQLSSFAAKGDIAAPLKKKAAGICDDILLSFHATIMADRSAHLQSLVENCFAQLVQAKEGGKKALETAEKQHTTIKSLLETNARVEESRRRAEKSRVSSEKLVHLLAAQIDLDEKTSALLPTTRSVSNA